MAKAFVAAIPAALLLVGAVIAVGVLTPGQSSESHWGQLAAPRTEVRSVQVASAAPASPRPAAQRDPVPHVQRRPVLHWAAPAPRRARQVVRAPARPPAPRPHVKRPPVRPAPHAEPQPAPVTIVADPVAQTGDSQANDAIAPAEAVVKPPLRDATRPLVPSGTISR